LVIKVLVVDDEELARSEMSYLLEDYNDVKIVGEASSGEEAVERIKREKPDLVFLDIQMPGMDGFQVVEALLDTGEVPLIIFATAYDQYAIRAFKANALDYLLKPIQRDELNEALDRARTSLKEGERGFDRRLKLLTGNIKVGTRFLPQIVVKSGEELSLVRVDNVAMLSAEKEAIIAYTVSGKFKTNYTDMDELEVQLDPAVFIRLGGDYLVNLEMISQIVPWSGGHYIMVLEDADKSEVELSRSQAKLLKNKVEGE
jgi:DNA-binding LytR/AlgR family response regulator